MVRQTPHQIVCYLREVDRGQIASVIADKFQFKRSNPCWTAFWEFVDIAAPNLEESVVPHGGRQRSSIKMVIVNYEWGWLFRVSPLTFGVRQDLNSIYWKSHTAYRLTMVSAAAIQMELTQDRFPFWMWILHWLENPILTWQCSFFLFGLLVIF